MGLLDKLKKGRTRTKRKTTSEAAVPTEFVTKDRSGNMPRRRVHGAAFDEREKRDALKGDVCGDIVEASWKNGAAWRLRIACRFYCS